MTTNPEVPLCGQCWEPTRDIVACERCGQAVDLRGGVGTYRLEARLGEGASGVTFRARRLEDGQPVCVKALSFRGLTSFEAERLFQRETAVLKQLGHPQIPNYIDSFSSGHGRTLALVLVQDLVDGVDLADEIRARRPSVGGVLDTLDELLSILEYLHGLAPPVIHRDIKPKNVMRRRDGRLVLIDFGAVKDAIHASFDPGMSLVGTVGYMAPEQLRGEASAASDLYAVGMVAVFLLSGREPATLLDTDHTVRWEQAVSVDPPVLEWLRRMTHPRPGERPASAKEARRLLAESRKQQARAEPVRPPIAASLESSPSLPTVAQSAMQRSAASPGGALRKTSPAALGVFGTVLLGAFELLALADGGLLLLFLLAGLLTSLGWRELARASRRGAKEAAFSIGVFAAGCFLALFSWRIGGWVSMAGQMGYFAATSLYLRSRRRMPNPPGWLRPLRVIHLIAAIAAVYEFVSLITIDGYDQGVYLLAGFVIAVAHFGTLWIFLSEAREQA